MTDVRDLDELLRRQRGLVARWQLVALGWGVRKIDRTLARLRKVHDGVHLFGVPPLSPVQEWWAATLTAPRTVLDLHSAGAAWELRDARGPRLTVARPGRGGPRDHGRIRVRYSATLDGNVTQHRHGFPITTPERTVIDLWHELRRSPRARERVLREAVRTKHMTMGSVAAALDQREHAGRRGVASLRETIDIYRRLPLARCKSDAEVEGLLILDRAGVPLPVVNERFGGEEADFCWPALRLIIEMTAGRTARVRSRTRGRPGSGRSPGTPSSASRRTTSTTTRTGCWTWPRRRAEHPSHPRHRGQDGRSARGAAATVRITTAHGGRMDVRPLGPATTRGPTGQPG